ncbi:response regulator transcription factor [Hydrogenophaga sp. PAMC20947]|uniref:response regulator n=1 Tax=Hydrogenophaga sp. PAMC20947 TaxID=2565558 RepID=UPI001448866D|nr:response regulator transcription factor [Hydrogenophaga sp. PAMC20947]
MNISMNIRILIIDDNVLFRKGLSALLGQQTDLSVVDDMAFGREAIPACTSYEPDVVVMDTHSPGAMVQELTEQIKRRQPNVKILVLTDSRLEEHVRAALQLGMDGYVLKDASVEEILIAIRSVAKGKKYLSPDVSGHVVESFLHPDQQSGSLSQLDRLTSRERGVLRLIAEGKTNRSAAEFLCVSPKTVEKHRASLMQKLGLRNATEITLMAIEMGIIERPASFATRMESRRTQANNT